MRAGRDSYRNDTLRERKVVISSLTAIPPVVWIDEDKDRFESAVIQRSTVVVKALLSELSVLEAPASVTDAVVSYLSCGGIEINAFQKPSSQLM